MARQVRRALADPGSERAGDTWDLAIFGHAGRLSFAGITQPWLREAAKGWAAEELPRHRGAGASNVQVEGQCAWRGCRKACAAAATADSRPPRSAGPTSRTSSAGSATSNQPGRSAATTATSSAGASAPRWPGSAAWA